MSNNDAAKTRIEWVDFAKCLGLLLVIAGHTFTDKFFAVDKLATVWGANWTDITKWFIYSFHMPLFFFLSFLYSRLPKSEDDLTEKSKRSAKALLVPFVIVFAINSLVGVCSSGGFNDQASFNTFIDGKIMQLLRVVGLGPIWFLLALWLARLLYESLCLGIKNYRVVVGICLALSVAACFAQAKFLDFFCLRQVFAVLPFCCLGTIVKKRGGIKSDSLTNISVNALIWIVLTAGYTFYSHDMLVILLRHFPAFPICYIAAVFGVIFFCQICQLLTPLDKSKKIVWLGRNSLWLLAVHAMDSSWVDMWWWIQSPLGQCIMRIAVDVAITVLVLKTRDMWRGWLSKRKDSALIPGKA